MASGNTELDAFVREALLTGQPRSAIAEALVAAGWREEQVRDALDGWADVAFALPVPRPRASLSARETFQYLLLFFALYFAAWHLGSLLFQLINRAFPDPIDTGGVGFHDAMRFSTAALVIAVPVFLFMAWRLARQLALQPLQRLSPVRRWLTYLTLFLAATVLLGDVTVLVYRVLGGEISVRFLLKVLVVALIAGPIFAWYLRELRMAEAQP